jgi:type II secretory pathway pseudopilin PulG
MTIGQFGIGSQPTYLPPILQSLQIVAQQLQQLQQLNYVQQQQIQQLQQWIQVVPQQIHQLGQQSQFGVQAPGLAGLVTQPIALTGIPLQGLSSAPQLFPQQPSHVM